MADATRGDQLYDCRDFNIRGRGTLFGRAGCRVYIYIKHIHFINMERSPKELFFESEQLKAAGKKKKEAAPVRSFPHTEESREEEERVNPPGRSGGRGYTTPFLKVEDVADTGMNPEEELMAKEEAGVGEDVVAEEKDIAEGSPSEHLGVEDYPDYYASREEWELYLRSLPNENYVARLRARFTQKHGEAARQSEEEIRKEREIEKQIPEALLQQPKLGKITHEAFGWDSHKTSRSDKQVGKEKSKRELPKSLKARRRFRKLKTALEKHL